MLASVGHFFLGPFSICKEDSYECEEMRGVSLATGIQSIYLSEGCKIPDQYHWLQSTTQLLSLGEWVGLFFFFAFFSIWI